MTYTPFVDQVAETAIDAYIRYLAIDQQAPEAASKMLGLIWEAVNSLETFPHRCPLAPENEFSTRTIRVIRVKSVLLLFSVNDEKSRVDVVGFRHGRQLPITDLA